MDRPVVRGVRGVPGTSALSSLLFVLVGAAACATSSAPRAPLTSAQESTLVPHAPGIAVDPVFELPPATANAEPTGGMAVLAEPVDPAPARRVVQAFFTAVIEESVPGLERVIEPAALTRANSKTRAEPALPWWQHRFERLDYTALGAEVFYRRSEMETHTVRDAGTQAATRPLPKDPRGDEVVVRVPILGDAADKLLGRELVFLLRRSTPRPPDDPSPSAPQPSAEPRAAGIFAGYKIAELFEDFRLP